MPNKHKITTRYIKYTIYFICITQHLSFQCIDFSVVSVERLKSELSVGFIFMYTDERKYEAVCHCGNSDSIRLMSAACKALSV